MVDVQVVLGQLADMARVFGRQHTALASQLPKFFAQQLLQARNLAHLLFKFTALPDKLIF